MDLAGLRAIFDREQRRDINYPDMRREETGGVVRFVRPAPGMSFVLFSDLDETTCEDAIREQTACFSTLGQPFEWKVYEHDQPADLVERLRSHGFEVDEPEAVMLLDLREVAAELLAPIPPGLRRVARREDLADVRAVLSGVWEKNFDWIDDRLGSHLEIPGYLSVFVMDADGQPVSTAWIYYHPGSIFADLWGGSTLPEYRGRGYYTALLAVRVQEALSRGRRYLTVDASPESQPILAKHGFIQLTRAWACEYTPPSKP